MYTYAGDGVIPLRMHTIHTLYMVQPLYTTCMVYMYVGCIPLHTVLHGCMVYIGIYTRYTRRASRAYGVSTPQSDSSNTSSPRMYLSIMRSWYADIPGIHGSWDEQLSSTPSDMEYPCCTPNTMYILHTVVYILWGVPMVYYYIYIQCPVQRYILYRVHGYYILYVYISWRVPIRWYSNGCFHL